MDFTQLFSGSGFGQLGQNDYEILQKAISTGYDVGGTTQTGGAAMRLESLDETLAILTEQQKQIRFLNMVSTKPATSTAIEYAQQTALTAEHGGFYAEGELPQEGDATYARQVALIKYAGIVKNVTMPAQLVRNNVDQVAEATRSGTMWLNRLLEKTCFKGNAKLGVAGAEGHEFDGLETFITRDAHATSGVHIIDLQGYPLEEDHLRDGGQVVVDYNGFASDIIMPQPVLEDYAKSYLKHMTLPITQTGNGKLNVGYSPEMLRTVAGEYNLNPLFLYGGLTRETPAATASTLAPAPATHTVATALAGADGEWAKTLKLETAADSGTVTYRVALANRYGEGTYVASGAQAITYAQRTNHVTVTVTNPAAFTIAPTYAVFYRQDTNSEGTVSDWGCVHRQGVTSVVGAATGIAWNDTGADMAGTYRAYMGDMSAEVISLRKLLPFTRIPLPMLALSTRFALVQFLTLVVRNPFRWVMFRNIGRRTV